MENTEFATATKEDQELHKKALAAMAHYYKHRDYMPLTRIVRALPNSNRRIAMLVWIRKFSVLQWDQAREVLVRKKAPEQQDFDCAGKMPFWTFKIKQEQRKHVSGNTFDPDLFFHRVLSEIRANLSTLPIDKLEHVIVALQKLAAEKRENALLNN
jgi:hypothetical protein